MVRHAPAPLGVAALATTLTFTLATTLAGCGGGPVSAATAGAVPSADATRSTATPIPSADASSATSTEPASSTRPPTPFGSSVTYQNDVMITVSRARRIHVVGYMETRRRHMGYVRFTVTVRNGSPSRLYLSRYVARIRSGSSTGHPVYDPTLGLNAPPKAPLQAAQTRTFDLAFGVDDTTHLALDLDLRDGLEPNRWATG